MLFVGCFSDPGDELINVKSGSEYQTALRVKDLEWEKQGLSWEGKKKEGKGWTHYDPLDKEAVEAIEAYMNK